MTHRTMSERSTSELRPAPLGLELGSVIITMFRIKPWVMVNPYKASIFVFMNIIYVSFLIINRDTAEINVVMSYWNTA